MDYVDQTKECRDCKGGFIFTAGEQRFFSERGFNPPVRCKTCRDSRKVGQAPAANQASPTAAEQQQPMAERVVTRAARHVESEDDWNSRQHKRHAHKTRARWKRENNDSDDDWDY